MVRKEAELREIIELYQEKPSVIGGDDAVWRVRRVMDGGALSQAMVEDIEAMRHYDRRIGAIEGIKYVLGVESLEAEELVRLLFSEESVNARYKDRYQASMRGVDRLKGYSRRTNYGKK